jgi:hypothetical protein
MLSMIVQLDNMTRYAELLTMPNGTRSFPARSCCDLKEQYPDIPSGTYWIDPNGGCSADAFQVDCDYEDNSCATCIDAKTWSESLQSPNIAERAYQSISNVFGKKVAYSISKVQLKMLQITSRRAEQAVTVHCQNLAFSDTELKFHTMKPGSSVKPSTNSGGCSDASSAGASSNFKFSTRRPRQLPVTDISLWLGSGSNEAMAVEFGPVCFSR